MRNTSIRSICLALAAAAPLLLGAGAASAEGTLDKLRASGKFVIGYTTDGSALARTDASGKLSGYAITLCQRVANAVKTELRQPGLTVDFVQLSMDDRFRAVTDGKVDLLCGAAPTLSRRAELSFSIPIGFVGISAVVRSDAPVRLVQVLNGDDSPAPVVWRGTAAPEKRSLAVVKGTTVESALVDRLFERRIAVEVVSVKDTAEGVQAVLDHRAAAFLDGRPLLVDAVGRSPDKSSLVVLDRLFSRQVLALGLRRNDDDFRLSVDRALSAIYRSPELAALYTGYFGQPDRETLEFFKLVALPE